jgi:K+-sensing histidine kinase KdpD
MTNPKHSRLSCYAVALLATGLMVLIRLLLDPVLGGSAPLLVFLAAVAISARYGGLGPGLLATALGALSGDFLFLEPRFRLLPAPAEQVRLLLFVLLGIFISALCRSLIRARRRAEAAAEEVRRLEVQMPEMDGLKATALWRDREQRQGGMSRAWP